MATAFDVFLLIITVVIVIVDIVLALCLRLVLPYHVTKSDWYPADDQEYEFAQAVRYCPCLYRIFPEDTKQTVTFKKIPEAARRRRSLEDTLEPDMRNYPYLVSLSIPVYSDEPEQKIFACNGLILSTETILTSVNCVFDESEWYNITIRSGSPYWSMLGKTHSVSEVISTEFSEFVELKVSPKISEKWLPRPSIQFPFNGNWTYAVSLGWNEHMYNQNLNQRYKYKSFDVEEWTSVLYPSAHSEVCNGPGGYKRNSKPLITSCNQLLATESCDGTGCGKFLKLNSSGEPNEAASLCHSVYKDYGNLTITEVCQY